MNIEFSKTSKKHILKLDVRIKTKLSEQLKLFILSPNSPRFRKHKLTGEYNGLVSINITGDYRLVYREISKNHIYVIAIGTHSQLYG